MNRILGKNYRNYWMGIAITAVMMLHLVYDRQTSDYIFKIIKMIFLQGDMGVNIFFFLSTYGLCHSYENNKLKTFYKNRFKRLFPIYFIFLFGIMMYQIGLMVNIKFLLYNILGLNMFPILGNIKLSSAWFIPAIILIYALFPILYNLTRKACDKGLVFHIILILTVFYYMPNSHFYILGMFHARFHIIILGIATYFYLKENNTRYLLSLYTYTAVLTLFTYNDCSFYFYIPLILYCIDSLNFQLPHFTFFSFIGKYSLEIYLAQFFSLQILFLEMDGNYYFDAIICLTITGCLAYGFHLCQKTFWRIIHV